MSHTTFPADGKLDTPVNIKKTKVPETVPSSALLELSIQVIQAENKVTILDCMGVSHNKKTIKELQEVLYRMRLIIGNYCAFPEA